MGISPLHCITYIIHNIFFHNYNLNYSWQEFIYNCSELLVLSEQQPPAVCGQRSAFAEQPGPSPAAFLHTDAREQP